MSNYCLTKEDQAYLDQSVSHYIDIYSHVGKPDRPVSIFKGNWCNEGATAISWVAHRFHGTEFHKTELLILSDGTRFTKPDSIQGHLLIMGVTACNYKRH